MSVSLTNPTVGVTTDKVRLSPPTAGITSYSVRLSAPSAGITEPYGRIILPPVEGGEFPVDGLLTLPEVTVGQFPVDGLLTLPTLEAAFYPFSGKITLPEISVGEFPVDGLLTLPATEAGVFPRAGSWSIAQPAFSDSFPHPGSWKSAQPEFSEKFVGEKSYLHFKSSIALSAVPAYTHIKIKAELGAPPVSKGFILSYGLRSIKTRQTVIPYSMDTTASTNSFIAPYAILDHVFGSHVLPWLDNNVVQTQFNIKYATTVLAQFTLPWSYNDRATSQFTTPYSSSSPAITQFTLPYSLPTLDSSIQGFKLPYSITNTSTTIQVAGGSIVVTDSNNQEVDVTVVRITPVVPPTSYSTVLQTTDAGVVAGIAVGESIDVAVAAGSTYTSTVSAITSTTAQATTTYTVTLTSSSLTTTNIEEVTTAINSAPNNITISHTGGSGITIDAVAVEVADTFNTTLHATDLSVLDSVVVGESLTVVDTTNAGQSYIASVTEITPDSVVLSGYGLNASTVASLTSSATNSPNNITVTNASSNVIALEIEGAAQGTSQAYQWQTIVTTTDQATAASLQVGSNYTFTPSHSSDKSYIGVVQAITPVTDSLGVTTYEITLTSADISERLTTQLRESQIRVSVAGVALTATNISLSTSEHQTLWVGQFTMPSLEEYAAISENSEVIFSIGSEEYVMVVVNKTKSKTGVQAPTYAITCNSPIINYRNHHATLITKTWEVAVSALAVVEEVLSGVVVDWQIQDWQIPSERLSFTDATPISIAQAVVSAIGGVVQSKPDGSVLIRYRYPVPMNTMQAANSDQVYSDADDLLSISESLGNRTVYNSVIIRDQQTSTSSFDSLSIEIDGREDGLNEGRTAFAPGEPVHLLIRKNDTSTITLTEETAGELLHSGSVTYDFTETVVFDNANTQALKYKADAIISSVWVGDHLGGVVLNPSGRDITSSVKGVGLLEITYRTSAQHYTLYSPETVITRNEFDILAYIEATKPDAVETGNVNAQVVRGAADKPAPDVVTDLLPSNGIAAVRGTQELDAYSQTQKVSVTTLFRPGVMSGHTAEILDVSQTSVWKGKITSVSHRYLSPKLVTTLNIERPL